jgi:hypothetical protein
MPFWSLQGIKVHFFGKYDTAKVKYAFVCAFSIIVHSRFSKKRIKLSTSFKRLTKNKAAEQVSTPPKFGARETPETPGPRA